MEKTKYQTVKGIDFVDAEGVRVQSFQLVLEDGNAYATADYHDGKSIRTMAAPSVAYLMPVWIAEVDKIRGKDNPSQNEIKL